MGFERTSPKRQEFERQLRQTCKRKHVLLRARPYNCTGGLCFLNGRDSISILCPICHGTGYLSGVAGDNIESSQNPLYNQSFLITADIQAGHGLFGAGGTLSIVMSDLGKSAAGDAVLFCPIETFDRKSGAMVAPRVLTSDPRPDRIISDQGRLYYVTQILESNIGDDIFALVCVLSLKPGAK